MSIRVFIVDDSAVVRKVFTEFLQGVAGIDVIGTALDPICAQQQMEQDWPDVIILDVNMPRMDGITFLKKIMAEQPTPVIMCSSHTEKGAKMSLRALSIGAIDVVAKPKGNSKTSLTELFHELVVAIRTAAKANMAWTKLNSIAPVHKIAEKLPADAMLSKGRGHQIIEARPLVAIGASTGGTKALEAVLKALPANSLPILIVQHMPETFTNRFAHLLNELCKVEVKEAEDNDAVLPGRVLIAPGGKHMMIQTNKFGTFVQIKDGPHVCNQRPSVDVLFRSVSRYTGGNTLGIIMTGMGGDGARGIKEMHDAGAKTIAQDEATCVVYGMPKEAVKLGAIDYEMALNKIPLMIAAHK